MATTTEEDFSFPVITETHPTSIDSPPLWHLSSASSPSHYPWDKLPKKEDEEEDKMDILWEDYFNQEVSKLEAKKRNNGDMVQLGCVQALKFSKNGNGAIFPSAANNKKPSIVVFIKVLKKLFLLHNNSHHHNKHNRAR